MPTKGSYAEVCREELSSVLFADTAYQYFLNGKQLVGIFNDRAKPTKDWNIEWTDLSTSNDPPVYSLFVGFSKAAGPL